MSLSLEETLLTVYQQSLIENKKTVTLENQSFPVRSTAKRKLKQIDFQFDGRDLRGLEQNPDTKSRWAKIDLQRKLSISTNSRFATGAANPVGQVAA